MANFASHDALCLARRFTVSSCTCGANRKLEQPWQAEWTPDTGKERNGYREIIDKPFSAKENQHVAKTLREKPLYVMNAAAIRARKWRAKKRKEQANGS